MMSLSKIRAKVDNKVVLTALYDIYDLPKSILSQTLNLTAEELSEIRTTEEYKTVKTALKTLADDSMDISELVADPEQMQVMITTERMQLYKDIQQLIKASMSILNDDLYQTKKHLVLQSIAILTNNLRQLLSDMAKTATEMKLMKGGSDAANINQADIVKIITASMNDGD